MQREPDARSQRVTCGKRAVYEKTMTCHGYLVVSCDLKSQLCKQTQLVELITLMTCHTGKTPLILYYHEKLSLRKSL